MKNYEGLVTLRVTQEARDWAEAVIEKKGLIRNGDETVETGAADYDMQYCGWVSEWMVRDLYGADQPKPEDVGPDKGIDFTRKGFTFDVKGQQCNFPYGSGRYEWGSNFRTDQLYTKTDVIIFAHYWKEQEVLFLPGWVWKKQLFIKDFAIDMKKGQKRGSAVARCNFKSVLDSKLSRLEPSVFWTTKNIII